MQQASRTDRMKKTIQNYLEKAQNEKLNERDYYYLNKILAELD